MLLIVAVICISIITNEMEEIFFCWLTLQIAFVKCWFKPLVHIYDFIVKASSFVFLVPVRFFLHPGHNFQIRTSILKHYLFSHFVVLGLDLGLHSDHVLFLLSHVSLCVCVHACICGCQKTPLSVTLQELSTLFGEEVSRWAEACQFASLSCQ